MGTSRRAKRGSGVMNLVQGAPHRRCWWRPTSPPAGLDIEHVTHVINLRPCRTTPRFYVPTGSGARGRVGRTGRAITFVTQKAGRRPEDDSSGPSKSPPIGEWGAPRGASRGMRRPAPLATARNRPNGRRAGPATVKLFVSTVARRGGNQATTTSTGLSSRARVVPGGDARSRAPSGS